MERHLNISRRKFFQILGFLSFFSSEKIKAFSFKGQSNNQIMTVTGPINNKSLGTTLMHEHILVDFIGAENYKPARWDREAVIQFITPYLKQVQQEGVKTFVDCTPAYLGRDPILLKRLSELTHIQIITNTGFYGGSDEKFLPQKFFSMTPSAISKIWIQEWNLGIDHTSIKPGFIKISVNPGPLSEVSKKLVIASALTHLATGLTIASHTGPSIPAMETIALLKSQKVSPSALIWVHAQNEKDWNQYLMATREGVWVSLDGLHEEQVEEYVQRLVFIKKNNGLHKILISHDAGWFDPEKPKGENMRGYTTLFKTLIPALEQNGFSEKEINTLIVDNPQEALTVGIKKYS